MRAYEDMDCELVIIEECRSLSEVRKLLRDCEKDGNKWYRITPLSVNKGLIFIIEIFKEV